jgi:hypothetical protein
MHKYTVSVISEGDELRLERQVRCPVQMVCAKLTVAIVLLAVSTFPQSESVSSIPAPIVSQRWRSKSEHSWFV